MIPTYSQTATCEYTIIVVFLMQAYPQHKQVLGFQGQGLLILYLIPDLETKHTFPEGFLSLSEILIRVIHTSARPSHRPVYSGFVRLVSGTEINSH